MAKFEYMQRAFSSELKPRARLVLQVLVLHCNKEGECFPSIKTIAAKCGYGVSTVKRALDELVKAGYIVKHCAGWRKRSVELVYEMSAFSNDTGEVPGGAVRYIR